LNERKCYIFILSKPPYQINPKYREMTSPK